MSDDSESDEMIDPFSKDSQICIANAYAECLKNHTENQITSKKLSQAQKNAELHQITTNYHSDFYENANHFDIEVSKIFKANKGDFLKVKPALQILLNQNENENNNNNNNHNINGIDGDILEDEKCIARILASCLESSFTLKSLLKPMDASLIASKIESKQYEIEHMIVDLCDKAMNMIMETEYDYIACEYMNSVTTSMETEYDYKKMISSDGLKQLKQMCSDYHRNHIKHLSLVSTEEFVFASIKSLLWDYTSMLLFIGSCLRDNIEEYVFQPHQYYGDKKTFIKVSIVGHYMKCCWMKLLYKLFNYEGMPNDFETEDTEKLERVQFITDAMTDYLTDVIDRKLV